MDKLNHTMGVHAGREDLRELGVHALPLDMSTTYPVASLEQGTQSLDELVAGKSEADNPVYARLFNPGVARYEKALAAAEGAQAAVAFSSGMAALTAAVLATRERGNHIVAVRPIYGTTDHLLTSGLLGNDISWVEPHAIADAVRDDTAFVLIETPGNPTLELIDIADVVAQSGDVPVIVDSTFATPVLQRPIEHGAAMVMHSATKFLGGHGDVIAGIMACSEEWAAKLRQVRVATGALLHPWAAYLLHRSLPTLKLRIERAQAVAGELVRRLADDPRVERVYYPGLDDQDGKDLLERQMDGPGCVLSFDVVGGYANAAEVISRVRLMTPAVSLGSVDTLIQHPAGLTHRVVDENDRADCGIREGLLRLSVGLEEVEDLWADLDQALSAAGQNRSQAA
ncbi:PLP-dependent transferase [Wenzhouxiangella sp. AB-CW3]|uniref:trans-sulfuration enzyme family protein n=1 Tax=Wenzhouxiangella sp. AB-CW3 TaxID=2771012 RepID=UPI00168B0DEE|nr:PLP-dependent transferase [Wenzhouxiangella sp. AB-CW3]QOC23891.1 PLP-dependent transferase [Wenzhouxiangella sp. AB-CW3]